MPRSFAADSALSPGPAEVPALEGAEAPRTAAQKLIFAWGVLGVMLVLADAAFRLLRYAYVTLRDRELGAGELAFFAGFLVFILYTEGYRGFQKRFSPRSVARAAHLARRPRPIAVALAPIYAMALFGATRRRVVASWLLVAGIVTLVLLVRLLPPVYRALVDVGVGCALVWGIVSLAVYSVLALRGRALPVPPDVQE